MIFKLLLNPREKFQRVFDEQNGLSCLKCTPIFGLENLFGLLVEAERQVELQGDVLGEPCDQSEEESLAMDLEGELLLMFGP